MKATVIFILIVIAGCIILGVTCAKNGAKAMERSNTNMEQLIGGF